MSCVEFSMLGGVVHRSEWRLLWPSAAKGLVAGTWMALAVTCGSGCGSTVAEADSRTEGGSWQPLAEASAWSVLEADADPFGETLAEPPTRCGAADMRVEVGGLEVDTSLCNYASFSQPLRRSLESGAQIRVLAWWQTLASLEPATGHLAVRLGDTELWSTEVSIPGPADAVQHELILPRSYSEGTPLYFHLHNHGYNTWNINQIEVWEP